jgi:response regulator of citrate/malate metabolism
MTQELLKKEIAQYVQENIGKVINGAYKLSQKNADRILEMVKTMPAKIKYEKGLASKIVNQLNGRMVEGDEEEVSEYFTSMF